MRVLVTGAAGFLGSHVADAFAVADMDVVGFDVAPVPRHRSIIGDLLNPKDLKTAFEGIDVVCHLAAVGDVYLAGDRPALAAAVNVTGTANVCDAALLSGSRVILASTWEVYGEPRYQPMDEEHPCEPDHPYSITKLAAERLAMSYQRLKHLSVVALRLGTAYGTRMRPNSVFSVFIDRALRGECLTIHGSGAQTRQFTHASDIGRAFVLAAAAKTQCGVFNIVAERAVSIRELAEHVAELVPTSVSFGPPREGDVPSAKVSSERAARELGWEPRMHLSDGLAEIVAERRVRSVDRNGDRTRDRLHVVTSPAVQEEQRPDLARARLAALKGSDDGFDGTSVDEAGQGASRPA
jgi:UDP-glucose 4-epimerase